MTWSDKIRTMKVRTNADTPYDAANARKLGAEGIGLCRTEHMFFDSEERILAIRQMIIADDVETRKKALNKLLPYQVEDFKGIFKAMDGYPVTVRLIDPPLHEFVPHDEAGQKSLAKAVGLPFRDSETPRRAASRIQPDAWAPWLPAGNNLPRNS
jgi:pyruvate, orthophosphate dikinase